MDVKQAKKKIDQGQMEPVYALYGNETHLMQTFVDHIIEKAALPEHREFAVTRFDLNETPIEVVLEDVETLPFMVPKKVVIASNAYFLTGKDKTKADHQLDRLYEYISGPVDYTVLILLIPVEKLDERKKIVKKLKAQNQLIPFMPLKAGELEAWVKALAKQKGSSISDEAVTTLLMFTGPQLQTIDAEIEKCATFAGSGMITREIVEQLVSRSTEQTVFMLIDEMIAMRIGNALSILHELLKMREEPIKIAMLMARQFRIILQVGQLAKHGLSPYQMASQLSLHPYAAKLAMDQARHFDAATLSNLLSELADLDYKMKSGKVDKVLGLEMFLLGLSKIKKPRS